MNRITHRTATVLGTTAAVLILLSACAAAPIEPLPGAKGEARQSGFTMGSGNFTGNGTTAGEDTTAERGGHTLGSGH